MSARDDILGGATSLGIELGSTRIKACLIGSDPGEVLATGSFSWENVLVDGLWSYDLDDVWKGLQTAFAALADDAYERHGARPQRIGALGISAMMHGYLAFDAVGTQLVPFRTWRNTNTGVAAAELSQLFGVNIPLRWTIAHLHQAVVDAEPHVPDLDFVTTLAGYVHYRLTGERVLGVGDASGVFPIDSATGTYDAAMIEAYAAAASRLPTAVTDLLPRVLPAGASAGALTAEGAALLDPTGSLEPGAPLCPPEGDAGTGMVATNSVAPRTGNVSAGTSIFAMVVLERPLASAHHELDLVTTPAGDAVAMVHCNNGASELGAWAGLFQRFAGAAGAELTSDQVFETLLGEALAGEPVAGLTDGRPVVVRTQDSELSLANFMRAQVYGVFGTLALGMTVLEGEGVAIDRMYAHGGMFRTAGVAQRFLAGAIGAPVEVGDLASEGGAWGIAVLASYLGHAGDKPLADYLADDVFAAASTAVAHPEPADVAGFRAYLDRYRAGLGVVAAAAQSL